MHKYFLKKEGQQKYEKYDSLILIFTNTQIKMTMRYNLIPVKMEYIKILEMNSVGTW